MLTLAATATPSGATHSNHPWPVAVLLLLALAWTAGYLLLSWIRPLRRCRRCDGLPVAAFRAAPGWLRLRC